LVSLAWELDDNEWSVVRYKAGSRKSSPILRDGTLAEFLAYILARSDGSLSLAQLVDVMRKRFNLVEPESIELSDSLPDAEESVAVEVERAELVLSLRARLGLRATRILQELERTGDPITAAKNLGLSRSEMSSEARYVGHLINEYADSPQEAEMLYKQLVESLF
jgi:hypothetical protein